MLPETIESEVSMGDRLVRDVIAGQCVISLPHDSSIADAARMMARNDIGALVITENGRLKGMFTERDAIRRVLPHDLDAQTVPVSQVMSDSVVTVTSGTTLSKVRRLLREQHLRHLPVVDRVGHVIGVISMRDTMELEWQNDPIEIEQAID